MDANLVDTCVGLGGDFFSSEHMQKNMDIDMF